MMKSGRGDSLNLDRDIQVIFDLFQHTNPYKGLSSSRFASCIAYFSLILPFFSSSNSRSRSLRYKSVTSQISCERSCPDKQNNKDYYNHEGLRRSGKKNLSGKKENHEQKALKGKTMRRGQGRRIASEYSEYLLGHRSSTYHDTRSKGVEFLRDIYNRADLRISKQPPEAE